MRCSVLIAVALVMWCPSFAFGQMPSSTVPTGSSSPDEPDAVASETFFHDTYHQLELEPNYWVPALEIFLQHLTFNVVARVAGKGYAQTTPESIWTNLTGPWEIDEDGFITNQIGHPYQGALYMTAARSSGLGFWVSALYTGLGSLAWEYLWETEKPSLNDQITTTFSGVLLGEVLHRTAIAVLFDEERSTSWLRRTGALAIDPMGTVNREMIYPPTLMPNVPDFWSTARVGYGAYRADEVENAIETPVLDKLHVGFDLLYGLPSEPGGSAVETLDHIDVRAELDLAEDDVAASLFMRGLVVGGQHDTGIVSGFWGLFAGHDFYTPVGLRVGAFNLSLGATLHADLGGKWFAQWTSLAGFVPIGAMGFRESTGLRDYQLGPGGSQLAEIRLGRSQLGMLQLTSRTVTLDLPFEGPSRTVNHNSVLLMFQVWSKLGLGAEFTGTVSTARPEPGNEIVTNTGAQARLFLAIMSDGKFGSGLR